MKKALALLFAAALFMAACSSDDETVSTLSLPSGGTLTGNWTSGCSPDGSGGSGRTDVVIATATSTLTIETWFSDAACTAGASDITSVQLQSFSFNGTKDVGGVTVTKIDRTITGDTLTPNTAAGTAELNGFPNAFGKTWTTGETQSTLGLDENGTTVPVDEKDIVAVDDTADPDQLRIGWNPAEDPSAPALDGEGYPAALIPNFFLTRN